MAQVYRGSRFWLLLSLVFWATIVADERLAQKPPGEFLPLQAEDHQGAASFEQGQPLVGTTYFYWYDIESGAHIIDRDGTDALTTHPADMNNISYKSPSWHRAQLEDMVAAGVDFLMPVYWGVPGRYDGWSFVGLPPLVRAHDALEKEGVDVPSIAMFYDTSILKHNGFAEGGASYHVDLTTDFGRQWFYMPVRDFFSLIPPGKWARIDGRPIVFVYASAFAKKQDPGQFEYVKRRFKAQFGVEPFIVKSADWKGPADATYSWGGAVSGPLIYRQVAALGPGYDHTAVPGRRPLIVERRDGQTYVDRWLKVLALNPNHFEAHNNLGVIFQESGRQEEAITSFNNALSINPDYAEAHNNLGCLYQQTGKVEEAISSYREAISLKSDYAEAYNNLGYGLQKSGNVEEAISSYRKAFLLKPDYNFARSNLLFAMNYCSSISQKDIFHEALIFADKISIGKNRDKKQPSQRDTTKQKLKIGYVSPDLCQHSVSFFIKPLLGAHNREKFEIYCYSDVKNPDIETSQIKALTDHWIVIAGKNDEDVMARIKRDGIDILVDLAGHTAKNRLSMFAQKAAPLQVSWLGYPNTTGLKEIDYRFTDAIADPEGKGDDFYSEELIRLKDCFLCFKAYELAPEVTSAPCLESGNITFGSFNNITKLTPEVVRVWAKILLEVPNSKLLLKGRAFIDEFIKNNIWNYLITKE